jgi:hypothetical protein
MQNKYMHRFETNATAITTTTSGAGTFTSGFRLVKNATIQVPGYVAVVTGVSGNTISFQLYQQSAATGALTAPSAAVTISAGSLTSSTWGF